MLIELPNAPSTALVADDMRKRTRPLWALCSILATVALGCNTSDPADMSVSAGSDGTGDGEALPTTPEFRLVYWTTLSDTDETASATLVEFAEGMASSRDLGSDVVGEGDRWGWFRRRALVGGRWVATLTQNGEYETTARVLDVFAPFDPMPPVQVGQTSASEGSVTFVSDHTLLVPELGDQQFFNISLVDLNGPFETQSTGGAAESGSVVPLGDNKHFVYVGGPDDGRNVMIDDLDPSTPPRAISSVGSDSKAVWIELSVDKSVMFYAVESMDGGTHQLWAARLDEGNPGPPVLHGEVNGEDLWIDLPDVSHDGKLYAVSVRDGSNVVTTRVGQTFSGSDSTVPGQPRKIRIFPDGNQYVYDNDGLVLADVAAATDQFLVEGSVLSLRLCGDLIVAGGTFESSEGLRIFNRLGEPVSLDDVEAWNESPYVSCTGSGRHVILRGDGRYQLLMLDGATVRGVDLGPDVELWGAGPADHTVVLHTPEGDSKTLAVWSGANPEPVVLARGAIRGFTMLP